MNLDEFRKKNDLTYRSLATQLGYNYSLVYKWCTGERTPSLKAAKKIQEKTNGKVTVLDICKTLS